MKDTVWTVDGDPAGWAAWAEDMAQAPASPLMKELAAARQADPGEWALDVGCGTGRAFRPLSEAGYRVLGLDPTAVSAGLSQQRAGRERLRAWPVRACAAALPVSDSSMALVFALGVLFHLSFPELAGALGEIRRVLHPGGRALLHFLDLDDGRRSLAADTDPAGVPVPSYRAVVTCFCAGGVIREWIESAGLTLMSLELRTHATGAGEQRNWLAVCAR